MRRAARIGGVAAASWLSLVPPGLSGSYARSAELIDPGGPAARRWWMGLIVVTLLSLVAYRRFVCPWRPATLLPLAARPSVLAGATIASRGLVFRIARRPLGIRRRRCAFPIISASGWWVCGYPCLACRAGDLDRRHGEISGTGSDWGAQPGGDRAFLPFLQVRYAVEGRISALFSRRAIRDRFRRAPWAFAFSLMALLLAAIPLYFLKIEMIPREAAWLPSLVFVVFLAPARLLTGWAYARSGRRDSPRHWIFRVLGRIAIVAAAVALRPCRLRCPVHVVGGRQQPLRTARLFASRPVSQHVSVATAVIRSQRSEPAASQARRDPASRTFCPSDQQLIGRLPASYSETL